MVAGIGNVKTIIVIYCAVEMVLHVSLNSHTWASVTKAEFLCTTQGNYILRV